MATAATATATMAAAGFDKRASTSTAGSSSTLQTPGSASFPSELRSPLVGSPGFLKRDHDLKTPITPPSAYLDFLKSMSPAVMSPAPTSTSARFSFNDKASDLGEKSVSPPTSDVHPSLSRNTSYESTSSTAAASTAVSTCSAASASSKARPESPRIAIPPSPFAKPGPRSARTPRRLQIPQSPFSPALQSAHSISSPYASTPLSGVPWSASYTPRDNNPETNGKPGKVSVRHVVTRTVTYCRTPLDPAPKGKRRKIEIEETSASSKESSTEPEVKFEKPDADTLVATPSATAPKTVDA